MHAGKMPIAAFAITTTLALLMTPTSAESCQPTPYTTLGAVNYVIANHPEVTGICLVARANGVTVKRCAGKKTLGSGISPDASTLWGLGSVTKSFVGTLLALRAAQGLVGLDDPLYNYLPPQYPVSEWITLRKLANHTSGLQSAPGPNANPASLNDVYADVHQCVQSGFPCWNEAYVQAEIYQYSNFGFMVLADVLADLSHLPWTEVNAADLMHDLEMPNTLTLEQYQAAYTYFLAHSASGHTHDINNVLTIVPPPVIAFYRAGAGALYSSTNDMAKWLEYNMGIHGPAPLRNLLPTIRTKKLGWERENTAKCSTSGHFFEKGGSGQGFQSFVGYDSVGGRGVVVLVNDDSIDAASIADELMAALP